jgi:hypothetical protein
MPFLITSSCSEDFFRVAHIVANTEDENSGADMQKEPNRYLLLREHRGVNTILIKSFRISSSVE